MIPNSSRCASACRYCRFYHPEGRRGGMCEQLNVSVQGTWKSCSLAVLAFGESWETIPEVVLLEKSFSLGCATPNMEVKTPKVTQFLSEDTFSKVEATL